LEDTIVLQPQTRSHDVKNWRLSRAELRIVTWTTEAPHGTHSVFGSCISVPVTSQTRQARPARGMGGSITASSRHGRDVGIGEPEQGDAHREVRRHRPGQGSQDDFIQRLPLTRYRVRLGPRDQSSGILDGVMFIVPPGVNLD
jgi:hypothetical protein